MRGVPGYPGGPKDHPAGLWLSRFPRRGPILPGRLTSPARARLRAWRSPPRPPTGGGPGRPCARRHAHGPAPRARRGSVRRSPDCTPPIGSSGLTVKGYEQNLDCQKPDAGGPPFPPPFDYNVPLVNNLGDNQYLCLKLRPLAELDLASVSRSATSRVRFHGLDGNQGSPPCPLPSSGGHPH